MKKGYRLFNPEPKDKDLTEVDLAWRGFHDATPANEDMLINQLLSLSHDVKSLDLSANKFGFCKIKFLVRIMNAIATHEIETLNLSLNEIYKMNLNDLVIFISNLPKSVTTLNLSHNGLGKITVAELKRLLQSIPDTVVTVNLSRNSLTLSKDETDKMLAKFEKKFILNDKNMDKNVSNRTPLRTY